MRTLSRRLLPLVALLTLLPAAVATSAAQERGARPQREAPHEGAGVLRLLPQDSVTDKNITIAGRTIA
jgi:hypothetical protein